jgi:predicted SnoaL-like aldol condensation-catalyzing enzyme
MNSTEGRAPWGANRAAFVSRAINREGTMATVTETAPSATRTSRKDIATTFLRMTASGDVGTAFDRYVSPSFEHHNPYFRGDADTLASGMEDNARQNPDKVLQVEHALEDGDMVAVHSRLQMEPGGQEVAVVHLFRFSGDRIVELWDVGQAAPADSPNENGMF